MWRIKQIFNIKALQKYKIPLILIPAAIFLITVSSSSSAEKKKTSDSIDAERYYQKIERELEKTVERMRSVNGCRVMITAATGEENEYLENVERSSVVRSDTEENSETREYLLTDSGNGKNVVIRLKKYPNVKGVLVIYDGPDDISIKKAVSDAVSTVLGVQSNKVCILSNQQ